MVTVENAYLHGNKGWGINIGNDSKNITIRGCRLINNSTDISAVGVTNSEEIGIQNNALNIIITDNYIKNDTATGGGVRYQSSSACLVISNNIVDVPLSSSIVVGGTTSDVPTTVNLYELNNIDVNNLYSTSGTRRITRLGAVKMVVVNNAAPTIGTWNKGDIAINMAPTAGGTATWICTAAGTPGTWKASATVSS
jgi:hypothetical protein